jgi:uncharacterized membrane protein YphA (DoxX/SURF4 family)
MKNLALLCLRLTVGTLMAGHGAQKLFGWFEGPGLIEREIRPRAAERSESKVEAGI